MFLHLVDELCPGSCSGQLLQHIPGLLFTLGNGKCVCLHWAWQVARLSVSGQVRYGEFAIFPKADELGYRPRLASALGSDANYAGVRFTQTAVKRRTPLLAGRDGIAIYPDVVEARVDSGQPF